MKTQEIKLKIHEEADLFSPMDPEQKLLSEEVVSHLDRNYLNKHRSFKEDYTLHIYSDSPVDEESVKKRIRDYYSQEKDNISFQIRKLTLKQIYLVAFGVIVLIIWYLLSIKTDSIDVVKAEIISITGWVAIWEAASIFIMQRPELVFTKKAYERLVNGQIIIDVDAG